MKANRWQLLAVATLLACGTPRPHAPVPAPHVVQRDDALPAAQLSTVSLPVGIPLADVAALLHEHVSLPNLDDYQVVTEEGKSPELAIRYTASLRDPVIENSGDGLRMTATIDYHGSFRARANTPVGWVWLTKGTDWGTPEAQGQITLVIDTHADIDRDWSLRTRTSLYEVKLKAPPVEELCTSGLFKVCVPASWARDRVHAELNRRVRRAVEPGLVRVDAAVAQRANLQVLAQSVWERLHEPAAVRGSGETIRLLPERIGLTHPKVRGDALVADLLVWCRPRFGPQPTGLVARLRAPAEEAWPGDHTQFLVRMARADVQAAYMRVVQAAPVPIEGQQRITSVALLGSAPTADRYLVAIGGSDERGRTFTAYAETSLKPVGAEISLDKLIYTPESEQLLTRAGVKSAKLGVVLGAKLRADLRDALELRLDALREALTHAVAPWPSVALPTPQVYVEDVYAAGDDLVFDVITR